MSTQKAKQIDYKPKKEKLKPLTSLEKAVLGRPAYPGGALAGVVQARPTKKTLDDFTLVEILWHLTQRHKFTIAVTYGAVMTTLFVVVKFPPAIQVLSK